MSGPTIHIHWTRGRWSRWRKTIDVLRWTRGMLAMPSCCYCRVPARECQTRIFWPPRMSYYGPSFEHRCAQGLGCNARPWSRGGSHLREFMCDGPPTFKRIRDGKHFGIAE